MPPHPRAATGSFDPYHRDRAGAAAMVARMQPVPVDDDGSGSYSIREDGRVMNPAYLFEVNAPGDSKRVSPRTLDPPIGPVRAIIELLASAMVAEIR